LKQLFEEREREERQGNRKLIETLIQEISKTQAELLNKDLDPGLKIMLENSIKFNQDQIKNLQGILN
jgi:DNA replication protein DnaD